MPRSMSFLSLLLVPFALHAADPEVQWVKAGTLSAPEAHQAAAADERFLYAISSTGVAKYDRATGRRLATSSGATTHLNSGFLHGGRLLCAHSNYPAMPERSEIKSLDLETMQLSTFHRFDEPGGSLVWVLRHDGAWWCNFAKYGEDNHQTFLARFDDEWKETGRWTYPASVIRQIGRYSLSGGVWHCGRLLVTDHDHRRLYELRLPTEGTVLELVATRPAPFTGQGIAIDPATGGLVGIDRARREVLLADEKGGRAERRIRVLTYNIHHGAGIDGRLDLERIADVIWRVRPDLVALQEVDRGAERTQMVDQPGELAKLTGLHVVFGANIPLQGGEYGNAVLSRWPIKSHRNVLLPNVDDGEQRGVLVTEIGPPGLGTISFLATHLDHRPDARERLASATAINDLAGRLKSPAILAGDLNDTPTSKVLQRFERGWQNASRRPQPTVPVGEPKRQIDFVLVRPLNRWRVCETRVLDEPTASDHRPVLSVLECLSADETDVGEGE